MVGQKIFETSFILFISFFILAVVMAYTKIDAPKWINKPLNIGMYGMIIGKIIKVWLS